MVYILYIMIIGIDDKNMAAGKALLLYQAYTVY